MPVRFGVDELISRGPGALAAKRLGLVTSDVATTASDGRKSRVALLDGGFAIVRLFGPEHGLAGTAADGAHVADGIDPLTRLPVVSVYGDRTRPPAETIRDLDAVLFDIPDVGARFYTYIWTLSHVLEACAEARKPLYVLDRPNPIGGRIEDTEGPGLDEANLSSFVGRWDIPIRHSLTVGELARLWNRERAIGAELHVIPTAGWKRSHHWPATALPFVTTSPAMPSYESALFYPGTCLFEGTQLSEGRGTEAPFRLIGAPWINGDELARAFNALALPGALAQPAPFVPAGRKYAGEKCEGVLLAATNPRALRPVAVGLHLLRQIIRLHPKQFAWLPYPTAANRQGLQHFDRLVGRLDVRPALDAPSFDDSLVARWTETADWASRVKPVLLYD